MNADHITRLNEGTEQYRLLLEETVKVHEHQVKVMYDLIETLSHIGPPAEGATRVRAFGQRGTPGG